VYGLNLVSSARPEKAVPLVFSVAHAKITAVPLVFGYFRRRDISDRADCHCFLATNSPNAWVRLQIAIFSTSRRIISLRHSPGQSTWLMLHYVLSSNRPHATPV
jgi:hypothetical protein